MTPTSPKTLKRVLEKCHYKMIDGDDVCWLMESNGQILVIPQTMKLVPEDVLESILGQAEISEENFAQLLAEIAAEEAGPSATAYAN
jgi:hypothetical protein